MYTAFLSRIVHSKTIRLASSYLGIIMTLSIGFSCVFYTTSANTLSQQVAPPSTIHGDTRMQLPRNQTMTSNGLASNGGVEHMLLEQRVNQGLHNLRERLLLLNIGSLLLGSVWSLYLARRTLKPIEAALEAQSRFASDASHELRTPLTVMQVELENALKKPGFPDSAQKLAESTLEEVKNLRDLSDELLRVARESQALELQPIWADEAVSLAIDRVARQAQSKTMTVLDTAPHVEVLADKHGIVEVLVILLDNAIKYTPRGLTIYAEGYADKKDAYLIIRDEGPGISAADLPHIFDRFYRGEEQRREHATGHGLGLSIAQNLVERQRGTITATSSGGHGATFTLKLATYGGKPSKFYPSHMRYNRNQKSN